MIIKIWPHFEVSQIMSNCFGDRQILLPIQSVVLDTKQWSLYLLFPDYWKQSSLAQGSPYSNFHYDRTEQWVYEVFEKCEIGYLPDCSEIDAGDKNEWIYFCEHVSISYLLSSKQVQNALKPIGDLVHFHNDLDKHAAPYFKKPINSYLKGRLI